MDAKRPTWSPPRRDALIVYRSVPALSPQRGWQMVPAADVPGRRRILFLSLKETSPR